MADRTAYATPALIGRNVAKWWKRRGGWLINSLILDELFTLRCMRALDRDFAGHMGMLIRRLNWAVMDLQERLEGRVA